MSLPMLFASGVRLELFEIEPTMETRIVRDRFVSPACAVLDESAGSVYAGVEQPPSKQAGYTINMQSGFPPRTIVYVTRDEVLRAAAFAAEFLLNLQTLPPEDGDRWLAWHTAAAGRECYNEHMATDGRLWDVEAVTPTDLAALFNEPAFWSLALSLKESPNDRAAAMRLAEVVERRGFSELARALRSDLPAAARVLPTKSARPDQFA